MAYPDNTPSWRRYLRFWKRNARSDVDAELRFHFDARISELVGQGVDPLAARAKAIEEFGDVGDVRETLVAIDDRVARRRGRGEWMNGMRDDVVYALRSLRRTPAVTMTIIVALALGLGLNAAMFSFLDQVFARHPVAVEHPESVRRLWWELRAANRPSPIFWPGFSYAAYSKVAEAVGDRAKTSIYSRPRRLRLARGETAPEASVVFAGSGYFPMLRIRPAAGRLFSEEENHVGAGILTAVISDAFWRRTLNGDPRVLGREILLCTRLFTVVGITRPGFTGIDLDATDVWVPLGAFPSGRSGGTPWWQNQNENGFLVLLQPAPGISDDQVEDRASFALRTRSAEREVRRGSDNIARLGSIVEANGPGEAKQEVKVATRLAGVAAIVLLIACANVINLLLARAVRRRREIAVRLALGISRARLVRLLVVESVILSLVAAVAAIGAAHWGGTILRSLLLPDVRWATRAVDWRVALFAIVAALLAGIVAGFVPAWQASRPDLTGELKAGAREGGGQRSRLRSGLVVVQAALSVMLLAGAMLFVRSLQNVHRVDIGFDSDRLVFGQVAFETRDSVRDASVRRQLGDIAARLRTIDGVEGVALSHIRPMGGFSMMEHFTGKQFPEGESPFLTYLAVSPDYFKVTGLRLLKGTGFPAVGATMPRLVVINQAMADAVWPGEDPIGRCMRFGKPENPCYTIGGIVANARRGEVIEDAQPQYYLPLDNPPTSVLWGGVLVVRATPERAATVDAELRRLIRETWPTGEPRITRMAKALEPQYRPWRLGATLFSTFGVLALIIAAVGIYSTVAYGVSQRTHEFGVRVALGAQMGDVLRQVIGEGLRMVAVGIALGVVLALAAGRLIAALLYGIKPSSLGVIGLVALILLIVAAVAALVPAWRAARVDPMTALRTD